MAVLKVKNGDEWVPVAGAGGGGGLDPEKVGALFAWINFDASTMETRDKFNISDIQKNSTGYYTIFFDVDPPDENYASAFGVGTTKGANVNATYPLAARTAITKTSEYEFIVAYASNTAAGRVDQNYVSILFFGKVAT
jgi:hypothetical protein